MSNSSQLLVEYYFPSKLSKKALDTCLASAWFRNGALLFRSKILCLEGDISSVLNIRLPLENYTFSKSLRKILRKNKNFEIRINKFQSTPEKEALFELQKSKFKGFVHPNLEHFFNTPNSTSQTIFNTYEITVYDNNCLIAASFFDVGKESIASLLGIYNPEYGTNSLGIFTMLLEVEFAIKNGKKYYYPGYILKEDFSFNYKLRLGEMQYYNWNGKWTSKQNLSKNVFQAPILKNIFSRIQQKLDSCNISYITYIYPLFTLGYVEDSFVKFNKSPIFILLRNVEETYLILEYDVDNQFFRLISSKIYDWKDFDIELPAPKEDGVFLEFAEPLYEVEMLTESSDLTIIFEYLTEKIFKN